MLILAEVKTQSPFGWKSERSWEELFEIANRIGDVISIHTDERWGGSFDLLRKARKLTDKPILAKGIHKDNGMICRALRIGADFALCVGRIPMYHRSKCLIEPNTLAELKCLVPTDKVVWNSRDLITGGLKADGFDAARRVFGGWMCQASNVKSITDVSPNADAVLVGSHLPDFALTVKR
jgi:indole-3-glycerol phosphate synthase